MEKQTKRVVLKKKKFLNKPKIVGLIAGILIILTSLVFLLTTDFVDIKMFYFLVGISIVLMGLPFFSTLLLESRSGEEKERMFLEFSRDLVEGVKSGTSISKSIINLRKKNYGNLTPHIIKLANQIGLGIPVKNAFTNFARDVKSKVIARAVTLIQEAESAGGKIETILESVASSIGQIEKLRKERKAAIYNLVIQGYIVFIIFIAIMLVMQFQILPITSEIGTAGSALSNSDVDVGGIDFASGSSLSVEVMSQAFLFLLIVQGFFAGLVIGKISEGTAKAGLKHSFILVALALLISTGASVVF